MKSVPVIVFAACGLFFAAPGVSGQEKKPGGAGSVVVERQAKPGFQISPLVASFRGRPGQTVRFTFEAQALEKTARLTIQPVMLKQEQTGLMVVDDERQPGNAFVLTSPGEVTLEPNIKFKIEGRIFLGGESPTYLYGLMVTDLGQPTAPNPDASAAEKRISINFITRYLLRIEVAVDGVRGESLEKVRLVSGGLVDSAGLAVGRLVVENTSPQPFELQGYCQIFSEKGQAVGAPFGLTLPVRANRRDDQRYVCPLLPRSTVWLENRVPEPLSPGKYRMQVELRSGLQRKRQSFDLEVGERDFPAQATLLGRVTEAVRFSPSQFELSLARGGSRTVPLTITNEGDKAVTISLAALPFGGGDSDWLLIRPEKVTLPPGRRQNVMVALRSASGVDQYRYAVLHAEVDPEDGGVGGAQDMPVVLVPPSVGESEYELGQLLWHPEVPEFVVPVSNIGQSHLVLDGELNATDTFGRTVTLHGGFGRWLLPGQKGQVQFQMSRPMPPGTYKVKAQISFARKGEPVVIEGDVEVK